MLLSSSPSNKTSKQVATSGQTFGELNRHIMKDIENNFLFIFSLRSEAIVAGHQEEAKPRFCQQRNRAGVRVGRRLPATQADLVDRIQTAQTR